MGGDSREQTSGEVQRFEVQRSAVLKENLAVAVVAGVLVALLLWFARREHDPVIVGGWAAATGVLTYAFYGVRTFLAGVEIVEIAPDAISVTGRNGTRAMRWQDVRRVGYTFYGGERWMLRSEDKRPLVIPLDGFSLADRERMNGEIRQRTRR